MNLLERVLALLHANLNTMAEKSEDPEKMLRQLQLDMRNQLVQVKTQVAIAIAEKMKLQARDKERTSEAAQWLKKAEQAIQQNDENVARDFLTHYNTLKRQSLRYQQQQQEQEQLVATLRNILRRLEVKISEVDTTIELLAAKKRHALLQQRVYDALSKSGSPREREHAQRAQDALWEIEARARALADLQERDLDAQLEQFSQERLVEEQLRQLKHKKGRPADEPRLLDEKLFPAELHLPLPEAGAPVRQQTNGTTPLPRLEVETPGPAEENGQESSLEILRRLMEK